jgi:hypothetical protein
MKARGWKWRAEAGGWRGRKTTEKDGEEKQRLDSSVPRFCQEADRLISDRIDTV